MIGVNFQPGQQKDNGQNGNGGSRPGAGVQEAIKVLSLRLPRVVGAQASASLPLLTSQGSGGNPRVDSVVNQVMQRVMPQGQPQAPQGGAPSAPPSWGGQAMQGAMGAPAPTPHFDFGERPAQPTRQSPAVDSAPNPYPFPRGPQQQAPAIDVAPRPAAPPMPAPMPPAAPTDLMSELRRIQNGGLFAGGGGGQNYF